MSVRHGVTVRGTSNGNARGSSADRRRRREWLVETYRADVDAQVGWFEDAFNNGGLVPQVLPAGASHWRAVRIDVVPACRCYRCGCLLTVDTVTVDRIIPGCQGGTYRRNNIRPACGDCNSETGGPLASRPKKRGRR